MGYQIFMAKYEGMDWTQVDPHESKLAEGKLYFNLCGCKNQFLTQVFPFNLMVVEESEAKYYFCEHPSISTGYEPTDPPALTADGEVAEQRHWYVEGEVREV